MKKELDEALEKKYPLTFNRKESCLAQRGIECDDGWYDILDRMCTKIESALTQMSQRSMVDHFSFNQVKEKFGHLTIYYWSDIDSIKNAVSEAVSEANTTCEACGAKEASLRSGSWITVSCDRCYAQRVIEGILRSIDLNKDIGEGKPYEWSTKTRKMFLMGEDWYNEAAELILKRFDPKK